MGPLKGVKVVEFAGIGPGPFCCMLLAVIILFWNPPEPAQRLCLTWAGLAGICQFLVTITMVTPTCAVTIGFGISAPVTSKYLTKKTEATVVDRNS